MDNITYFICMAGDHLSLRISKHIQPNLSILGWYIYVLIKHFGGFMG